MKKNKKVQRRGRDENKNSPFEDRKKFLIKMKLIFGIFL